MSKSNQSRGNFEDLRWLLDEIDKPLLIEVSEPTSMMKSLCEKLMRCPATHNRVLLDDAETA